MVFEIRRSAEATHDLERIFRHLIESYLGLGDDSVQAIERAEMRMNRLNHDLFALARLPYQGTLFQSDSGHAGLRHVTKNRAIIYFEISEAEKAVHVLAVFFSGQDHQRHMAERLTKPASTDA